MFHFLVFFQFGLRTARVIASHDPDGQRVEAGQAAVIASRARPDRQPCADDPSR